MARRGARMVDPACPIEWSHPFNRRLVGAWLGVPNPGWTGGATLRDCARGGRDPSDGSLLPANSGGTINGPKWVGGINGFRALSFDGVDDRVEVASQANQSGMSQLTVDCWVKPGALVANNEFVKKDNSFILRTGSAAGLNVIVWTASIAQATGGTLTTGVWQHVALSYDGANLEGWINGKQVCTTVKTGTVAVTTNVLSFGNQPGGGGFNEAYTGLLTNVFIRAQYIHPGLLYQEARRGHLDTLRWLDSKSYFFGQQAAAASNMLLARRRKAVME